jgi:hypothetical protein
LLEFAFGFRFSTKWMPLENSWAPLSFALDCG